MHRIDESDSLKDIQPDTDKPAWQKAMEKRKPKEQKKEERMKSLETAVEATNFGNPPALKELAQYMGISERSLRDGSRSMEASIYKMEKCGKKRKFVFSAKCQGLRKKTYLHVFCKIQIVENNMFFSLPAILRKKT